MKTCSRNSSRFPLLVIALVALCGLFPTHCKKFEVTRQVIIKTERVTEITYTSCRATGTLLDLGERGVSDHGFCWARSPNPADAIDCNSQGAKNDKGQFFSVIEGLSPETKYYLWAYANEGDESIYGIPQEFTTQAAKLPEVETGGTRNISYTSAECEYNVVSDGGIPVTGRGLCWNTEPAPTVDGPQHNDGTGTGLYIGVMEGLGPGQLYYVRAFARNDMGVAYGGERTFTTQAFSIPTVHTGDVAEITHFSAVVGGAILSDGGMEVSDKGFCWNEFPNPTIDNYSQVVGGGPDPFEMTINGLRPNTTYYVRAFAVNDVGIAFGEEREFITLDDCGIPFTDERDGKVYQTIRIGDQCWMAQNLDFGVMIDRSAYASNNGTPEKYCYDNNPASCESYGGLYSWDEMMQYVLEEGTQGVCPGGWHIPSDGEWKTLEMALGMTREIVEMEGWRGFNEGGKLKVSGIEFWDGPNEGATNESGFSALPAGGMDDIHQFDGLGFFTDFWTSSWNEPYPWYRLLNADRADIYRTMGAREFGTSVRCVKD
jgi:uncharacterized protein (TIGR02145 family)